MTAADAARDRSGLALGAAAVVVGHHLTTALDASGRNHTPQTAATTTALLGLARRSGVTWDELGLTAEQTRHGMRLGGIAAAAIAGLLAVAARVPAVAEQLAAGAADRAGTGSTARIALVDIPVNVVMEELVFRGVLPIALPASSPAVRAAVSTILFGLWHVLPSLDLGAPRDGGETDRAGRAAALVPVVVATTAAGVAFEASRRRSDSLLAPVLVHGAINVGAFLAGRRAARVGRRRDTR